MSVGATCRYYRDYGNFDNFQFLGDLTALMPLQKLATDPRLSTSSFIVVVNATPICTC